MIKIYVENNLIKGFKALKISSGTVVKVVLGKNNLNDILLKVDSKATPFVNLKTGHLWGDAIGNYSFLVLSKPKKIELIEE